MLRHVQTICYLIKYVTTKFGVSQYFLSFVERELAVKEASNANLVVFITKGKDCSRLVFAKGEDFPSCFCCKTRIPDITCAIEIAATSS